MTARWDQLPPKAREKVKRRPAATGAWRCIGLDGCGEVLTGTWAAALRHADEHGGHRLECIARPT